MTGEQHPLCFWSPEYGAVAPPRLGEIAEEIGVGEFVGGGDAIIMFGWCQVKMELQRARDAVSSPGQRRLAAPRHCAVVPPCRGRSYPLGYLVAGTEAEKLDPLKAEYINKTTVWRRRSTGMRTVTFKGLKRPLVKNIQICQSKSQSFFKPFHPNSNVIGWMFCVAGGIANLSQWSWCCLYFVMSNKQKASCLLLHWEQTVFNVNPWSDEV